MPTMYEVRRIFNGERPGALVSTHRTADKARMIRAQWVRTNTSPGWGAIVIDPTGEEMSSFETPHAHPRLARGKARTKARP